jgi:hypothetical protein
MLSLRPRIATVIATVVALFVLLAGAGFVFMYSGVYDVSASSEDNPFVAKLLHATRFRALDPARTDSSLLDATVRKREDGQRQTATE